MGRSARGVNTVSLRNRTGWTEISPHRRKDKDVPFSVSLREQNRLNVGRGPPTDTGVTGPSGESPEKDLFRPPQTNKPLDTTLLSPFQEPSLGIREE